MKVFMVSDESVERVCKSCVKTPDNDKCYAQRGFMRLGNECRYFEGMKQ